MPPTPEMSFFSHVSRITHTYYRNADAINQTKVKNFALYEQVWEWHLKDSLIKEIMQQIFIVWHVWGVVGKWREEGYLGTVEKVKLPYPACLYFSCRQGSFIRFSLPTWCGFCVLTKLLIVMLDDSASPFLRLHSHHCGSCLTFSHLNRRTARCWVSQSLDSPSPPIHPLRGYRSLLLKYRSSCINSLIRIIQWLPIGCRINSTLCMSCKAPKASHSPRVQHEQPWILPSQDPCCSGATSPPQSTPQTGRTLPHLVLEEASSSCCSPSQQQLPNLST